LSSSTHILLPSYAGLRKLVLLWTKMLCSKVYQECPAWKRHRAAKKPCRYASSGYEI